MSLSQALATAVSGLRASQAGLSLVAGNVANAETPGYVRKTAAQVETAAHAGPGPAALIGRRARRPRCRLGGHRQAQDSRYPDWSAVGSSIATSSA